MMARLAQRLNRFMGREDGSMTIEFVIIVPAIFTLFLASVEFGIYSMRQMFLDRGLDVTVRTIRLNTATVYTHDTVKQMICDNAGFLNTGLNNNCDSTMRLEMLPMDLRAYTPLANNIDCVDLSQPVNPPRNFVNGSEHALMVIRACVKFDPVFATTGIGAQFPKDGAGKAVMYSMSAFVQEPD
ncbi:MAG: TadE/TadG family type IV pilus assembly protein [Roseobacter sp.]